MAIKLKIKALCVNVGYCESARTSSMFVGWHGTPFEDARAAITSFVDACHAATTQPKPVQKLCCTTTLLRNPSARACEKCGTSTRAPKRKTIPLDDYLRSLADATIDGFGEVSLPFDPDGSPGDGSSAIGDWHFFEGFPVDCDVVVVDYLDYAFTDSGRMPAEFHVVHVGKAARRASSKGKFTAEETP